MSTLNEMEPHLFKHTDRLYVPEKALECFTDEEKKAAPWPAIFSPVLVISICPERYARFMHGAGWLGSLVEKVTGVDGRCLGTIEDLVATGVYAGGDRWNCLTRGQIGCFLSHRKAWQRVVDGGFPTALITEDDCNLTPHPDTIRYLDRVVRDELDFPWEMLYLGRNPALCKTIGPPVRPHLVRTGKTWGLFAYVVTLEGARKLLRSTEGPISAAVDVVVSTMPEPRRRVALSPMALFIRAEEESDTARIL